MSRIISVQSCSSQLAHSSCWLSLREGHDLYGGKSHHTLFGKLKLAYEYWYEKMHGVSLWTASGVDPILRIDKPLLYILRGSNLGFWESSKFEL